MPFIDLKTNIAVTKEDELKLKSELGQAIALIPGKSERWLMLSLAGSLPMYFAGDGSPCAFIEVKIFGKAGKDSLEKLTARLCEVVSGSLAIDPSRIYIKYEECSAWGWNGGNF